MLGIIIAFFAGGIVGVLTMCCCQIAGRADSNLEKSQYNSDTSAKKPTS